jgi:hypothetical protein
MAEISTESSGEIYGDMQISLLLYRLVSLAESLGDTSHDPRIICQIFGLALFVPQILRFVPRFEGTLICRTTPTKLVGISLNFQWASHLTEITIKYTYFLDISRSGYYLKPIEIISIESSVNTQILR